MSIQNRKKDHVDLTLNDQSAYSFSSGFDSYLIRHNALPEINFDEIETKAKLLGRTFAFPLFISSMTGGYDKGGEINRTIAEFCQHYNLPFGVGSQRIMLEDPSLSESFKVVRKIAPDAFVASNIGGCQLIQNFELDKIRLMIDSIQANAVIIHLNPLQELMQPEGDRNFKGVLAGIENLVKSTELPVIVKETGAGIDTSVAKKLINVGVSCIDISGAGGTSWSKVENLRKGQRNYFDDWGLPTSHILESYLSEEIENIQIISSGGIRTAHDIIVSLCLGAHFTAAAQPVVQSIIDGGLDSLSKWFENIQKDFKTIMCLTGTKTPSMLNKSLIIKR